MRSVQLSELGEVLSLSSHPIVVQPDETYRPAGILNHGRGLFERQSILGADTSAKTLFVLRAGQIAYSRLFAFEGSAALVTEDFDGCVVSQEFPTFSVRPDRAVPEYLGHIMRWPAFHEQLAAGSRGLGQRRQRVHPDYFLSLKVPLPPIVEQRCVADRLQLSATAMAELEALRRRQSLRTKALVEASVWAVIARGIDGGWPVRALGEVAEINPRPARPRSVSEVTFVPMAAVDEVAGAIHGARTIQVAEAISGYKQFTRGDVIFARITPCMQNGKCAVFDGPHEHGLGSTEFHVLRPGNDVLASWVHRFLRTRHVRDMAAERFTGTAGQQRVPADFLRSVQMPVPPVEVQRAAVASIDVMLARAQRLTDAVARAQALATAFTPANLNRAFGSSS